MSLLTLKGWLEVVSVPNSRPFPVSLGSGEAEAIQLALETDEALLIMDDRLARREALRRRMNFIGTARMLHLAESRSLIEDAAVVVQQMAECGYRISPLLLQQLKA